MNPYEALGRERKAAKIALWMREYFAGAALPAAEKASESEWDSIARMAKTTFPSEDTRARVRELLAGAGATAEPNDFLTARADRDRMADRVSRGLRAFAGPEIDL